MTDESNILIQRLRQRWRKAQQHALIRGLAEVLAVAVLLVFITLAIDWSITLSGDGRVLLMVGNLIVLAAAVYLRLLRRLRPFSPLHEALREEAEHPELQSIFVSSLQLDEQEAPDRVSPDMIRLVKRRAAERVQDHAFGQSIRFEQLRKVLAVGGGAVVVLLIAALIMPAVFGTLFQRMLIPYSTARYPSDTKLALVSGDMTVRQYDSVEAVVEAGGVVPERGEVLARPEGGRWERLGIERGEGDRFAHAFDSVAESFDYRFVVGDARTPIKRVTVVPPPRIVDASVTLRYPDYTRLNAETGTKLNVEAPEGAVVEWTLELDRPVDRATLVTADDRSMPAELSADRRTIRASLRADASLAYRYRFDWTLEGRAQQNETARHFIQVIPDVPPRVAITYPRANAKATLSKRMTIEFNASDDYAIDEAELVYTLNDGRERTRDLDISVAPGGAELPGAPESPDAPPGPRTRKVELDPKTLVEDLREGDMLSYRIEVADNRAVADGPQRASSRTLRLQFVSEQDYLADVIDRRSRFLSQLKPIYQQEREAYGNLAGLAEALGPRKDEP